MRIWQMRSRQVVTDACVVVASLAAMGVPSEAAAPGAPAPQSEDLRVHEWGTFTTLHWPTGPGLAWYQNTSAGVSELPSFVHSLGDGLKGLAQGPSTARMETPVLYFYTDRKRHVDVSTVYHGGSITEFYPRDWTQLELIPPGEAGDLADELPVDPSRPDNHYYQARAVPEAAFVRHVPAPDDAGNQPPSEVERFVFYRGVGSFSTGLTPRLAAGGRLTLTHLNVEHGIEHAWVVESSGEGVRWVKLAPFAAFDPQGGQPESVRLRLGDLDAGASREASLEGLAASVEAALVDSGLTDAEAAAMVATWDEQWFGEPGRRVFSIPPQAMIDAVLPLEIAPAPVETIRVFVHRAELLGPETQEALELATSPGTDPMRAREIIAAQQLGRFVHGALGGVADDVAARTRTQFYNRGLEAIRGSGEWIDLAEEGAVVILRADVVMPADSGNPAELILATAGGREGVRIELGPLGQAEVRLHGASVSGPPVAGLRTGGKEDGFSILLRIEAHAEAPDEVFVKLAPLGAADGEPAGVAGWTLVNRKGAGAGELSQLLVRGGPAFRNIRVARSFAALGAAPIVIPGSAPDDLRGGAATGSVADRF